MSNDTAKTITTNIVPVQGIFTPDAELVTLIGPAGTPFAANISPEQSGLIITDSTIDSTPIGVDVPAEGHFTSATVEDAPVGGTDVANKLYVDSVAAGLSWKQPVVCATTGPITLSGLQTIDLVTVTEGQRVLVKNQSSSSANGIYNASASTWTRSEDANTWNELISAITFIESGSQNGSAWYCSAQPGGTLGATPVNWSNFSVAGQYFAGTGLSLNAYTFAIANTGVTAASYGSGTAVPVIAVNAQGQITSASTSSITPAGIGAVASVTATAPVASSGGTNPIISMPAASASADGYLTSSDWSTFNNKQPAGTYVTSVTGTAPVVSSGGTTPAISMHVADATNDGYLSSTDWSSFNSKVSMVYPGAGIPNSTGSAWGTSYSTSGTGTVIPLATAATINNPTISNYVDFGNGSATTLAAGRMWYDGSTGSWNLGMGNGNITQQVGEEQYIYGKASAAITEGQLIVKTGVVGASGVITFGPSPTGLTDNDGIIGVATENIALNGFGRITTFGVVHGINTSGSSVGETWADNDTLYYNPSYAGGLTKVKPTAPNIKYEVATVINAANGGAGSIQVNLRPGSQLGGTDQNVQLSSPTGGQLLTYNETNGYWKNTSLTAGTGISITPTTGGAVTIASTVTSGISITDDTTTNATRYPLYASVTTGTVTTEYTSSTKFQFNPSTGALTATSLTPTNALGIAYGGTGATTLAGANIPVTNAANTFTAKQTFTGSSSVLSSAFTNIVEPMTVSATAATGTINYDVTTQSVLYYTTSASANWTVNFRASSGTSLDSAMATGDSVTVAFLVTQGATAYYNNAITIDGTSVTPKYQGGTAWSAGNASGVDAYVYVIVKTGSATFSVFASQTQFK